MSAAATPVTSSGQFRLHDRVVVIQDDRTRVGTVVGRIHTMPMQYDVRTDAGELLKYLEEAALRPPGAAS